MMGRGGEGKLGWDEEEEKRGGGGLLRNANAGDESCIVRS